MENIKIPLLALRGLTVFPHMTINFDIGRELSLAALEEAMAGDQRLVLVTQVDPNVEHPKLDDLYDVGTIVKVKQMLRMPGDTVRVLVEGLSRAVVKESIKTEPYFEVYVTEREVAETEPNTEQEALMRSVVEAFEEFVRLSNRVSAEILLSIAVIKDPEHLTDLIAANALYKQEDKQEILETFDIAKRLERLIVMIGRENEILEIEKSISHRVREQVDKLQKEHYLNEQIKAIQSELGQDNDNEIEEFKNKVNELPLEDDVKEKVIREINRLSRLPQGSPEVAVLRTWLEWIMELPWKVETEANLDLKNASQILEEDHYGLAKVKERIIEYLAVCQLTKELKGPILCFVGPPGVGKTSIAKSIARATGRKFARMSLGGVRDEAEIRGHRRTYVGAIPGRIIHNIKQAGSCNPVFLFDEIDKMSNDFRGDPASAMLEVLDSEQNFAFVDHYLEIPFDLSKVMFLATANSIERIPPALMDRMEIIYISGYTEDEKINIARRHLVAKQISQHGIAQDLISISDNAMKGIITGYTREAGVRNLEREIANICRKSAREIVEEDKKSINITNRNLSKYLGVPRFKPDAANKTNEIGLVTGLAWTAVGGVTLNIEANIMPGSGKLQLTGQLGDVMQESAKAALSYIRSSSKSLGIDEKFYEKKDIHVHIPEGATPKDGPSAGITMATAIFSAIKKIPVRSDIAMTGEITLRGRVLPIGGLKEKILAAHRVGIKRVLIPYDNAKDISEIPDNVKRKIIITHVKTLDDVLKLAIAESKNDANKKS